MTTLDVGSSSSAPPPPPPPAWIELPEDVTANILQRLGAEEILESAQKVCTTWWRVCKDPALWRVIDMTNLSNLFDPLDDSEMRRRQIMCRHAVDRSQGQLIDISVQSFGTDDLLSYVSQRCNRLKRLTLLSCKGVREAVENFPELEELHLFSTQLHPEVIESVGMSCPRLKSFTYMHGFFPRLAVGKDDWALAVSRSMPNLHHLHLFRDNMKNEGLEAILDSCPHLESLDIRRCFGVDLRGDLGKRCSQQIKDLRCPYDSVDDYKWRDLLCFSDCSFGDFDNYDDYDYYDNYDYDYYDDYDCYEDCFNGDYSLDLEGWYFDPDN